MSSQDITDKYNSLSAADKAALGAQLRGRAGADKPILEQTGLMRSFANGAIYSYLPAGFRTPNGFAVFGPISTKWMAFGGTRRRSWFGLPVGDCDSSVPDVVFCLFERGIIANSATGVFEAHDAIYERWKALGGVNGLGIPTGDQTKTAGSRYGLFNDFVGGSIYWVPGQIGPTEVLSGMMTAWRTTTPGVPELGPLGYPVAPESAVGPITSTRFQDFENGSLYDMGGVNSFMVLRSTVVFTHSFEEIPWNAFGTTLRDGDIVSAALSTRGPQFPISVTLNAGPGVTKTKTLALWAPGPGNLKSITVGGTNRKGTMSLTPGELAAPGRCLILQKERGPFNNFVYLLRRADRLIGTDIDLTWVKD